MRRTVWLSGLQLLITMGLTACGGSAPMAAMDAYGAEAAGEPAVTSTHSPEASLSEESSGMDSSAPASSGPASSDTAASPNLLGTIVTGGGGDGERHPDDPVQIPRLPAPLLIYTANLRMMVDAGDIPATIEAIVEQAVSLGGYLAGRTDRSVQVRVPSTHFREGLAAVEQIGEVTSRNVAAQDVSEEYHDLDVRLTNLRALRERLAGLLSRTTTIEEVLRVESELERIAREIDQLEGRLRFLRSRVAFSLVTVNVDPRPAAPPPPVEPIVEAPPPPPPPRFLNLPIEWLSDVGLDGLLDLS